MNSPGSSSFTTVSFSLTSLNLEYTQMNYLSNVFLHKITSLFQLKTLKKNSKVLDMKIWEGATPWHAT